MNKLLSFLLLFFSLLTLNGCAMMNETVPLNHQPTPRSDNALMATNKAPIHVGPITDQRDDNPNLIVHKMNMDHDTTSGGYLAEQPIATIVQDALTDGLQDTGYKTTAGRAVYTLNGTLNSVDLKTIMGIVKGTVIININTTLNLTNQNGQLLWSQTLIGHGREETAWGGDYVLRSAFNKALDDLVHQLQESTSFRAAMRR